MLSIVYALDTSLKGNLFFDNLHKSIYATDASVYRKVPLAVAFPKDVTDIQELIAFATKNETTLIPRTAGTSLAGQCVGDGIVVDVSKHFTNIISFDKMHKTVTVQPGVIRDELNLYLKPHELLPTIPPIIQRLEVEVFGPKNKLCGFRYKFNSSLITPG